MTKTALIIATGPSIDAETLDMCAKSGLPLFGMNHVYKYLDLDYFLACNPAYYDAEWNNGLKDTRAEKWTWDIETAERYNVNLIRGQWGDGFSTDPRLIHYGHSSGFQLPQIAYHKGYTRLLLVGYDMRYAKDYNGAQRQAGSTPRHFFGEYSHESLKHWPSKKIENGVFVELIRQFEKVKEINKDIEIINCTPNSAMTCFPMYKLSECIWSNQP